MAAQRSVCTARSEPFHQVHLIRAKQLTFKSAALEVGHYAVVRRHVCGNLNLAPIEAAEVSNTPSFAYILGKHPQIALAAFPLRRVLVSELSPQIHQDRKR